MILNELKINNFRLKEIMKEYDVTEQEFTYADVQGVAELLGWQIVFFRKRDDLLNTVAISFDEIIDKDIKNIANTILKRFNIELQFGEYIKNINEILGVFDFADNILEDTVRYGYILPSGIFISIGLTNARLSHLEIVTDEEMVKGIVEVRRKLVGNERRKEE